MHAGTIQRLLVVTEMMLARRLQRLRTERKLTQRELASVVSLSSSTIAMYESGKRMPDLESLKKLASFFEITTDYLLGRTEDRRGKAPVDMFSGAGSLDKGFSIVETPLLRDLLRVASSYELTPEDIEAIEDLLQARRIRKERESQP